MRSRRPLLPVLPGGPIGLFGGSFDPAHRGHFHAAETARQRLGLRKVLWMVAAQNPLKLRSSPFATRFASARQFARGIGHQPVDAEQRLGTQYTWASLRKLRRAAPRVRLVWIMGTDALAHFHRWQNWRAIAATLPICVIARGASGGARARLGALSKWAGPPVPPARLIHARKPVWCFLNARLDPHSSTAIRAGLQNAL